MGNPQKWGICRNGDHMCRGWCNDGCGRLGCEDLTQWLECLPLVVGQWKAGGWFGCLRTEGAKDLLVAGEDLFGHILVRERYDFGFPLDCVGSALGFGGPDVSAVTAVMLDCWPKVPLSTACGAQDARMLGFLWTSMCVPGEAIGVVL
jgi:hypothetical protein